MPRPPKIRKIQSKPERTYFKPPGIPMKELEELVISFEEMETLRLSDYQGLSQQEGADKMEVSRPTYQRILVTARKKVAEALAEGKAIRIEGGTYQVAQKRRGRKRGRKGCPKGE
ncbi:MAG: DUF134 domain-containing protein [Halanaerobiaceae bacterium]